MKSKYITVLNHIDCEVYQHELPDFKFSTSDLESWLVHNGYSLSNIEWIVHPHPVVIDNSSCDCECKQCCRNTN